jgi:hypothetical protein
MSSADGLECEVVAFAGSLGVDFHSSVSIFQKADLLILDIWEVNMIRYSSCHGTDGRHLVDS